MSGLLYYGKLRSNSERGGNWLHDLKLDTLEKKEKIRKAVRCEMCHGFQDSK